MLLLLLLQGPGIEPCKSALKVDTLTTDPLGTIYDSVEISRSDKASVDGESLLLSYCCCPLLHIHFTEVPSLALSLTTGQLHLRQGCYACLQHPL